jgi:hypothetical protein
MGRVFGTAAVASGVWSCGAPSGSVRRMSTVWVPVDRVFIEHVTGEERLYPYGSRP